MRLQLTLAVTALVAGAAVAHADGELTMRGVYYKERATRVIQPMLDAVLDTGESGTADAHLLVDAITSASFAQAVLQEQRYEIGGGYLHQLDRFRFGGLTRISVEPDYTSVFAGLRGQADLFDRNLALGLAVGAGRDALDNSGEGPTAPRRTYSLNSYLTSVSAAQILGPNTIVSLTYDLMYLDGFQANIYRRVIVAGEVRPELHPPTRLRHALAGTARQFIPATETTAIAGYRFYVDDWGVRGYTPEVRVIQDAGPDISFGLRYRWHSQTHAEFYQSIYEMSDAIYVTDDPKLSAFRSHTFGARFEMAGAALGFGGRLGSMRGELVIEYVAQGNRFGNAGIAHAAITYPFEY